MCVWKHSICKGLQIKLVVILGYMDLSIRSSLLASHPEEPVCTATAEGGLQVPQLVRSFR